MAVLARGQLEPDVLVHRGRPHWVPARELVFFGHGQRPYAKYVGDGNRRIHGVFTERPPDGLEEQPVLHALRGRQLLRGERETARVDQLRAASTPRSSTSSTATRRAAGARGATTSLSRPRAGRESSTRDGSRAATRSSTRTTTARGGSAAASSRPAPDGRRSPPAARHSTTRTRASSTSRARSGRGTRSRLWFTPDNGRTWTSRQLTHDPTGYSIRPVTPRGLTGADRILYVRGDERTIGFTDYRTRVHALDF